MSKRNLLKTKPMKSNKLGIAGVCEESICRLYQFTRYFRVFWTENKKRKSRYFNINKLGRTAALKLAKNCRREVEERINKGMS